MTPPSPSFSFGNSDTERTTSCWHSPRLLLRFPDENEEAAWPEEEMICADSVESSSHMISMSESSPALIEGGEYLLGTSGQNHGMKKQSKYRSVHTPYADGEYEYEYFLSHYIEGEKISRKRSIEALVFVGDRIRMITVWASGDVTNTVAGNFKVEFRRDFDMNGLIAEEHECNGIVRGPGPARPPDEKDRCCGKLSLVG